MGVVYLARDTRLDRDVAIKALPEPLARDPERLARFEREAKTLAQLDHPNVAGIYGVEEHEGARYLVLEYVEGETLAEQLARGALPFDEALEIAIQIASGVEAAHEAGVIHRDLKPGNVIVTSNGKAKVLDFGLARADETSTSTAGANADSPTLTNPAGGSPTIPGVILGTAAYMSPEQARGRKVDKRTDIWSFGVVLYEMLTGVGLFRGETTTDSIGAVLHKDVDLAVLPQETPQVIRHLLNRCLSKDRDRRLHDIADARVELEAVLREPADEWSVREQGHSHIARRSPFTVLAVAIGFVVVVAGAGVVGWSLRLTPNPRPVPLRKLEIQVEGLQRDEGHAPVISPDGSHIVLAAKGRLLVRSLDSFDPIELPGTQGASHAFWSPDSQQIGFHDGTRLWRIPSEGGSRTLICVTPRGLEASGGACWTRDGRIVFTTAWGGPMLEVRASGGQPRTLLRPDPALVQDFHFVSALPDGSGVLSVIHRADGWPDAIVLIHGDSYEILFEDEEVELQRPVYAEGHIIYGRVQTTGTIWAIPYSLETHKVTGKPFLVAEGANVPSASNEGTLIYAESTLAGLGQLAWVDRTGAVTQEVGRPMAGLSWPMLSPDESWCAATGTETGTPQAWVFDMVRGTRLRVPAQIGRPWVSGWVSNDRVAFTAGEPAKTYVHRVGESGPPEVLIPESTTTVAPGARYALQDRRTAESLDIVAFDLQASGATTTLLDSTATETEPLVRPGGGWFAYVSDESGRDQVYFTAMPETDRRWQASIDGGVMCMWSPDGARLYFLTSRMGDGDLMYVTVTTEPDVEISAPQALFSGTETQISLEKGYSPSSDENRILGIRQIISPLQAGRITVIENWAKEHRER